ncbi:hypothetical protein ACFSKU_14580 [Pontibacter silvestris]|uniref:Uncharacterized protein n=1 Tax=Pontibacter silvestris TaxID=2305183 RepID=A0ABW4WZG1_9BACT|nr:hypothetical protein [Pontibacter silvestris]MCC9138720.1 hypothetical protein [Pontibacter silvestris]
MQTLTNQKQPLTEQQGQKRQQAKQQKVNNPEQGENQEQSPQQEEGLYRLVKQDEALRAYHTAKLLDTPGYSHLSVEEAGDVVEQMLRLSILMYEMLLEEGQTRMEEQNFIKKTAATESNHGSNK